MPTRAEQKSLTRARLVDAAALLVATQGVERTSVEAIAQAAGVTIGALYASFASKAELLRALVTERHTDLSHIPLETLAADLGERLEAVLSGTLIEAQLVHELLRGAASDEQLRVLLADRMRAGSTALAVRITDEAAATRLSPHDTALALQVLIAGMVTLKPVLGEALSTAFLTSVIALLRGEA